MDRAELIKRISGCYIAIPTLFHDADLELNLPGMRRHIRFMLEGGVRTGNAVLLVCGGAGDFSTLTTEERLRVTEAVVEEAAGRVGVILGAQTTDQRELVALARGAERLGAVALQLCPPFYHPHTTDDIYDFFKAAADAADVGLVYYTTYWTGYRATFEFLARLTEIPQMVGVKWATPSAWEYQQGMREFAQRYCMIDNQLEFVLSHMLGGRGINPHPGNYWPQWAVKLWGLLEAGDYKTAQDEINRVIAPYYKLSDEISRFTGGEGHLDKLCLELIGLDSSRCRPPTRDIRPMFREKVRKMLLACGVPGCK